jgi:hypothetical protein
MTWLLHLLLLCPCICTHEARFRFCLFCPSYRYVPITPNYSIFPVVLKPELRKGRPHLHADVTRRPTPRRQSLSPDGCTTAGPYGRIRWVLWLPRALHSPCQILHLLSANLGPKLVTLKTCKCKLMLQSLNHKLNSWLPEKPDKAIRLPAEAKFLSSPNSRPALGPTQPSSQ